jgi:hypothetical protein
MKRTTGRTPMASYAYLDYPTLKHLNGKAIKLGLNRTLSYKFFDDVDREKLYPVTFSIDHNDGREIRAKFIYNEAADGAYIDMLSEDFSALPTFNHN